MMVRRIKNKAQVIALKITILKIGGLDIDKTMIGISMMKIQITHQSIGRNATIMTVGVMVDDMNDINYF